jgi:hypothetical protein
MWYRLRSARATPPARVRGDDRRRQLFASALEQFEEYMAAAAVVGAATRPLQLYYALAQGGAAIVAARADVNDLPGHHGLRIHLAEEVHETVIRPKGCGMFQTVASSTESATLTSEVRLGELWASLPELVETIDEEVWPVAVRAGPIALDRTITYGELELVVDLQPLARDAGDAQRRLSRYPTLPGEARIAGPFGIETMFVAPGQFGRHEHISGMLVRWDPAAAAYATAIDDVAPEYAVEHERWLRPTVGAAGDFLSPLMAWWALLFGLSMLSRYHPVRWARALDIDASPVAADLEYALRAAMTSIPRLVLEGIWGEPIVVRGTA